MIPVYIVLILVIIYLLILIRPFWQGLFLFVKDIGVPFLLALIFAYLLHPLVNGFVRLGLKRVYAVSGIFLFFILLVVVAIVVAIPMLIRQAREFTEQLPAVLHMYEGWYERLRSEQAQLPLGIQRGLESGLAQLEKIVERWTSDTVSDIGDGISSFVKATTIAMLIPFIVFYMLKDFDGFHTRLLRIWPKQQRKRLDLALREIHAGLGSYISGQLLVSLLVGILVTGGYFLIKFPYPLVFGIISMIFNIIPYLGAFFSAIPALIIGITVSWKLTLWIAVVNVVVQIVEGNFIAPYIVGKTTQLHPLSIIVAVLVGGELAGIAGLILAVPALVMLKVIVVRLADHYLLR